MRVRWKSLVAALGVASLSTVLMAAAFPTLSFEEKVRAADVVVIATATEKFKDKSSYGNDIEFTLFQVEDVLKGSSPNRIAVLSHSDFAEFEINCCLMGKRYMLFLDEGDKGRYSPVYSRSSALPL